MTSRALDATVATIHIDRVRLLFSLSTDLEV